MHAEAQSIRTRQVSDLLPCQNILRLGEKLTKILHRIGNMGAQISESILSLDFLGMSQLHLAPLKSTDEIEFQINEKKNPEPTIS